MNEFINCEKCKTNYGSNCPTCPTCEYIRNELENHSGYFNLLNGWTCYSECKKCKGE
jgi:hypothetical protein